MELCSYEKGEVRGVAWNTARLLRQKTQRELRFQLHAHETAGQSGGFATDHEVITQGLMMHDHELGSPAKPVAKITSAQVDRTQNDPARLHGIH